MTDEPNNFDFCDDETLENDVESEIDIELLRKKEELEKNIKTIWGHSTVGAMAKQAAMSMLATKTGMYSRIPLYCKGENCPYREGCVIFENGFAPVGELCPVETAKIELLYEGYRENFDLDSASFTDQNLVLSLINHDIMLDRCRALLRKEEVPIQDVIQAVTEDGTELYRPEVSKALEVYERVEKKRNEIYNLMSATRKDNKDKKDTNVDILEMMSNIATQEFVIPEKPDNIVDVEIK